MEALLPLASWGQLFNSLGTSFQTNLEEHVTRHITQRCTNHLKRVTALLPNASFKKIEKILHVCGIHTAPIPVKNIYDSFTHDLHLQELPQVLQDEIHRMRGFITQVELKAIQFDNNLKFSFTLFKLHMYIQSSVPLNPDPSATTVDVDTEALKKLVEFSMKEKLQYKLDEIEEEEKHPKVVYNVSFKGFSATPISSISRTYITIDTKVFEGIKDILNLKIPNQHNDEEFLYCFGLTRAQHKRSQQKIRRNVRRLRAAKGFGRARKGKCTNGKGLLPKGIIRSIMTDGVGMSIRTSKFDKDGYVALKAWDEVGKFGEKIKNSNEKLIKNAREQYEKLMASSVDKIVRFVGLDPGRSELFHTAEQLTDGSFVEHRFKRSKYIHVSSRKRIQETLVERKKLNRDITIIEGALATSGGWKARSFNAYLVTANAYLINKNYERLHNYYCAPECGKLKMVLYRKKDSVIIQRFKKVLNIDPLSKNRETILIGYGCAKIGIARKGEAPVPTVRAAKILQAFLKRHHVNAAVVDVWEFATSQQCNHCETRLLNFKVDNKTVRGLKLCKSNFCSINNKPAFRNRDGNAARNILSCLIAACFFGNRPKYLCPVSKETVSLRI